MEKTKPNIKTPNKGVKEVITIPDNIAVFTDKQKGFKTVAFFFTFPSGVNGMISVTHLDPMPWKPTEDVDKIELSFK